MKRVIFLSLIYLFVTSNAAFSQGPSVDDFLPPVQGGSTEIKEPTAVEVTEEVVTAATPQDAMNAAVEANIETIKEAPEKAQEFPELGARWTKFKSGSGILATGMGVYQEQTNPTAGLIAQRNAYVVAYMNAKKAMTETLGEISSTGKTIVNSISKQVISGDQTDQELTDSTEELIEQTGQALLKGYVTYRIDELVDDKNESVRYVFVSIASYPKTLKASQRSGAFQEAADISAGIQNVLDEVKNGIVPPVGARVVTVPSSGQTAFIAFGSSIVTPSRNPALAARNKLTAQKIADTRAYDALTGILVGDKTMWTTGVKTKVDAQFAETDRYGVDSEDPDSVVETVEAARQTFTSETTVKDSVSSIRRGVLPAGIQKKSWIEEDGNWAMSMVVFYPDLTAAAQKFGKQMGNADLLSGARGSAGGKGGGESGTKGDPRKVDPRVKPRKGGKIGDDDGE